MNVISRRDFVKTAVAAAAVSKLGGIAQAQPLGLPIGSQTYPHRQRIVDGDFAGLCKDLAGIGVQHIELCCPGYKEFASLADGKQTRKIIEDHGLKCYSAHFTLETLHGDKHDQMIQWAHDIGMTQMSTASLTYQDAVKNAKQADGTYPLDTVKAAADDYNKVAAKSAKAGLQQMLHDEGFEMSKITGEDRLVYTALYDYLDPKLVKFQFQMSAMRVVGDPITYFQKYPGRIISMHCQGVDLNAPIGQRGAPAIALGKDSMDWPKIFAAAGKSGLKNYYVEQAWDATVQSVAYLKTLKA